MQEDKKHKNINDALSELIVEDTLESIEVPMTYDGEQIVTIRENAVYKVAINYHDGFVFDEFHRLYQDYFEKYDYIVGDWAHERLRLRGFYQVAQRNVPKDRTIDFLDDYLKEYCSFGCAYFVLAKEEALANYEDSFHKYTSYISKPQKIKNDKVFSTKNQSKRKHRQNTNSKKTSRTQRKNSQSNIAKKSKGQKSKDNFNITKVSTKSDSKKTDSSKLTPKNKNKSFVIKKKED